MHFFFSSFGIVTKINFNESLLCLQSSHSGLKKCLKNSAATVCKEVASDHSSRIKQNLKLLSLSKPSGYQL